MATSNDPFQFQDFGDDFTQSQPSKETSITIDDDFPEKQKTSAADAGSDYDEEDDKAELLGGEKKSAPFWTFEYYQRLFDIETHHVRERILGSVLPWPGKNFIHVHLRKNPDLYGPFWICTTLVFAIAISGNLSSFLVHLGNPNFKYTPEFQKVTIAATAIFSYAGLVPLGFWGFLVWRSSKVMNLVTYSFMEILCVYGYSLSIYIPAVVLCTVPYEWLRWCTIAVALSLSGSVLVMTFLPAVRDDHPKVVMAAMSSIVILNALLAIGCKMYFFSEAQPLAVDHPAVDHPAVNHPAVNHPNVTAAPKTVT
ncbi:protein YIPF1 [Synchiropus picturatus]